MYALIGAAAGLVFSILIVGVLFLAWPRRGKPGINTETVFCPACGEKMPKTRTPKTLDPVLWGG